MYSRKSFPIPNTTISNQIYMLDSIQISTCDDILMFR